MSAQVAAARGTHAVATPTVAVLGNPNTGKSTLFNALTGLRQKVANYPGVTVEKHLGTLRRDERELELVDLPGTYSLAAHSPDELIAVDVLCGRSPGTARPAAAVVVVDATNLRRNLFLVSQVAECGMPVVVALNMVDLAQAEGIEIDHEALSRELGVAVVPTVASRGTGTAELSRALLDAVDNPPANPPPTVPEIHAAATRLAAELDHKLAPAEVHRALVDVGGAAETRVAELAGPAGTDRLAAVRTDLGGEVPLAVREARARYAAIDEMLARIERRRQSTRIADRVDRVVNHPLTGSLLFVVVMGAVFQAVFAWATPLMNLIDGATAALGRAAAAVLPEGALASLVVDGAIAGVGAVVIFLPQIVILFAFIILLEDTGYMARAAFVVDRLMRACGLSGHSFIPMLSSFACAVPGIMATRVIRDRRDRLATIMAAPFMTCSARLPVYALLIGAFVPPIHLLGGILNLQGLVLLGLYLAGIAGGTATAWLLKRTLLRGPAPPFLMELPPYRWPAWRSVLIRLWDRAREFLVRAGTVIFAVSLVVWALAYFPRSDRIEQVFEQRRAAATAAAEGVALEQRLARLDNQQAAAQLEHSFLGRAGRTVQVVFAPLGWDWKVSAAVVASLPAREVVVAVLGTTYAVGAEVGATDDGLMSSLRSATHPDGRPVFTLPVALGLMVFFALCLQCVSTLAIMRREMNSWVWPLGAWVAMTAVAWLAAFATVQLARWAG